jgi:hypothetical protein
MLRDSKRIGHACARGVLATERIAARTGEGHDEAEPRGWGIVGREPVGREPAGRLVVLTAARIGVLPPSQRGLPSAVTAAASPLGISFARHCTRVNNSRPPPFRFMIRVGCAVRPA